MSEFIDYLFGPLDKKYCAYFYYLSVIGYILMLLVLLTLILLIFNDKKIDLKMVFFSIYMIVIYFIMYFQSRLLNSVCISSLK